MAKSIFEILDDLTTETKVNGEMIVHTIPRENYPGSEVYADSVALLNWADGRGITHSVLQHGVKAFLISDRARFKAVRKGDTWTQAYGQENVDAAEWTVQERPKEAGGKIDKEKVKRRAEMATIRKTILGMRESALGEDIIGQILKAQFDGGLVDIAMAG